VHIRTFA